MKGKLLEYSIPEPNTGCWLWMKSLNNSGYGYLKGKGAHRVSYEAFVGPIPQGLFVCHKCDTPACVNPDHLFLGTHKDNMHDMHRKGRNSKKATAGSFKKQTQCPRGHAYTESNLYFGKYTDGKPRRKCRTCHKINHEKYRRGLGIKKQGRPLYCKKGHEYIEGSYYVSLNKTGTTSRQCKKCAQMYYKKIKQKQFNFTR